LVHAASNSRANGAGHMDAINLSTECWFSPCSGSGPWPELFRRVRLTLWVDTWRWALCCADMVAGFVSHLAVSCTLPVYAITVE
jgi:hypothetical protein